MDVKKNKNSMYIKIKKNKQSCCRLPDAKKKKEVKNKMDVKNKKKLQSCNQSPQKKKIPYTVHCTLAVKVILI